MSILFRQQEIGDYRVSVYQDETARCPCTEFDLTGVYIWQSCDWRDKSVSHCCNWEELFGKYSGSDHDLRDGLKELVRDYVPQKKVIDYIKKRVKDYRLRYDMSARLWYLEHLYKDKWCEDYEFRPDDLKECDCIDELCEALDDDDLKALLYDCKDIAFYEWGSRGYCQGDEVDGFAYCDKERFAKMCDTNTKNWRQRAVEQFKGEVEEIETWLWGDACRYALEKKVCYHKAYSNGELFDDYDVFGWEELESADGYYMDADDLIEEVIAEHGLKEMSAA